MSGTAEKASELLRAMGSPERKKKERERNKENVAVKFKKLKRLCP